jgi:hypothetical protein
MYRIFCCDDKMRQKKLFSISFPVLSFFLLICVQNALSIQPHLGDDSELIKECRVAEKYLQKGINFFQNGDSTVAMSTSQWIHAPKPFGLVKTVA